MTLAQPLLFPRSIAIVGASDDPAKTAYRPLAYLRRAGYDGTVYPVARRETVAGERAWSSLPALPETPDHAFVLLPTEAVADAVIECVRLGVPVVTVLAGGFAEAGPEGAARQARLVELVRGTGTRLLGPNSMGLVNLQARTVLTANAAFAEPDLPVGDLFVASHSGTMLGALASRGKARGIGFGAMVSVGAEADLSLGVICEAVLDTPGIGGFVLFLETLRDAAAIRRFAQGALDRGKPVVAYKLGRSAAASELALSHTGALAGEDGVAEAFFAACGIARVETLDALLEAPALLRRVTPSHRRPRVGVVTTTGGGGAMVVDQLGIRGIEVAPPPPETLAAISRAGVDVVPSRMVDLTLAGVKYPVMRAALEAMLAVPEYDLVIAAVGSSARFQPELAVKPAVDLTGERLAVFTVPDAPEALAMLAAAGVPAFRTPESCADAVAAAWRRRPQPGSVPPSPIGPTRLLDELGAYALLDQLGIPRAASAELTGPCPLPYPVAVKLLSDTVAHKSDSGGVVLNVADDAGLEGAAAAIRARNPGARLMVQAMTPGLGEALIGYRIDPQAGPIVIAAAGGTATELYQDRSIRLAPISLAIAHEMLAEVRGFALLRGWRGRPAADLDALARALTALSRLADRSAVRECEINPLIVRADGVVAVDAVVWVGEPL
jgi:acyl-CoA synthetase (NDP forming)